MKSVPLAAFMVVIFSATFAAAALSTQPPADRVIAIYFHRTQRCPTCLKMGSYAEEAVKKGYAKQVKEGSVQFYYVDYQDKKNASLTKGYKISGPALVLAKITKNKVKKRKTLKEIWTKVSKKPEFLKYVRKNVEAYLNKPQTAMESRTK